MCRSDPKLLEGNEINFYTTVQLTIEPCSIAKGIGDKKQEMLRPILLYSSAKSEGCSCRIMSGMNEMKQERRLEQTKYYPHLTYN